MLSEIQVTIMSRNVNNNETKQNVNKKPTHSECEAANSAGEWPIGGVQFGPKIAAHFSRCCQVLSRFAF